MIGCGMARVLLFDVNETLLDLRVLDPVFERAFGDASLRRQWFGLVLRNAMALTITGDYEDFLASLCPAHRGGGRPGIDYLPLGK